MAPGTVAAVMASLVIALAFKANLYQWTTGFASKVEWLTYVNQGFPLPFRHELLCREWFDSRASGTDRFKVEWNQDIAAVTWPDILAMNVLLIVAGSAVFYLMVERTITNRLRRRLNFVIIGHQGISWRRVLGILIAVVSVPVALSCALEMADAFFRHLHQSLTLTGRLPGRPYSYTTWIAFLPLRTSSPVLWGTLSTIATIFSWWLLASKRDMRPFLIVAALQRETSRS